MKKYILICQNCFSRNYRLNISTKVSLSLQKYCKKCKKKTIHRSLI